MNIRKRDKNNDGAHSEFKKAESSYSNMCDSLKENIKKELSLIYWCSLFVSLFVLFDLAIRLQSSCEFETDVLYNFNAAKDRADSLDPVFNDSIARQHLRAISRLGRRPTGSMANEVHTPGYILKYAREIVDRYSKQEHNNLIVTIDEHVSGINSFPLVVFGKFHMSSIYDKIRSVAIRVHDSNSDLDDVAVLINCHYDSFFGGIGASDDLASCVVMLESFHSLLRYQPVSLRADIIFLFNGAEENILQASHAFITQHRWSSHVKLVVNLEAAGSGGRQMIFQASPRHPWIVAELGRVLRQPFASVIGQELFSANLIPSDTDYRIFRDFGHVPGVDLAFIGNGYIYHTSYDTEQRIPQTCLRHTGDNILRAVIHLANVDMVGGPEDASINNRVVFFDWLGLVLVSYTERTAFWLNLAVLLLSLAVVGRRMLSSPPQRLALAVANQLTWFISSLLLALALGGFIHRFGVRMAWYSIRYNVLGLFLAPLLWYFFFYHNHISKLLFRVPTGPASAESHRHASLIILAILVLLLTFQGLLSAYFVSMWLLFCCLNDMLSLALANHEPETALTRDLVILVRDLVSYCLPMTYFFYMVFTTFDFFLPVMGRTGPAAPDIVVAILTGLALSVPGLIFASNIYVTSKSSSKWLMFFFLHLSISYYIFIHSSQFGFPYNQSETAPRKQRIFVSHVTRNIRNSLGQTQLSESGLWIVSLDTNNVAFLKSRLEQVLKIPMQDVFCELRPYCGYPLLFPFASIIDKSLWIPQSGHKVKPSSSIIILNKITHISGMVNVTMQINGPSHSPIYIMTPESMRLLSWSLGPDPPQPIDMPSHVHKTYRHYFIFYGYGDRPPIPLTLWITFMPKIDPMKSEQRDQADNQIEIAVAAHYLMATTNELDTILHLMPKWTIPTPIVSSYEHIVVDFDQHLSFNQ